jgi:hypothetical protein
MVVGRSREQVLTLGAQWPSGSAAGQENVAALSVDLGTRCFSGFTGSHGFARFFGRCPSQGAGS